MYVCVIILLEICVMTMGISLSAWETSIISYIWYEIINYVNEVKMSILIMRQNLSQVNYYIYKMQIKIVLSDIILRLRLPESHSMHFYDCDVSLCCSLDIDTQKNNWCYVRFKNYFLPFLLYPIHKKPILSFFIWFPLSYYW